MSYSFEYIDIILLAMIAGFIFLRLRGILGKKTGHEENLGANFVIQSLKLEGSAIPWFDLEPLFDDVVDLFFKFHMSSNKLTNDFVIFSCAVKALPLLVDKALLYDICEKQIL